MRRSGPVVIVLAALALVGCGSAASSSSSAGSTSVASTTASASTTAPAAATTRIGPEGIPLEDGPPLASASTTTPGTAVDGIHCAPVEQLAYHIHAHLQVYVDGQPRRLPAAIGMIGPVSEQTPNGPFYGAEVCYYWLHTHATDGIIHIESPTERIYTLGDFFDEWRQPLGSDQVGPAQGKVTAFVNGALWRASPRAISLDPHQVIQLDVGKPIVAFHTISFAGTDL